MGIFPIPGGSISLTDAGNRIFGEIAKRQNLFTRGGAPHEIKKSVTGSDVLSGVSAERFCNLVEDYGHKIARREIKRTEGEDGAPARNQTVWRNKVFPVASAKLLLESNGARNLLPPVTQLANCPILTRDGILGVGYHPHAGGTFIGGGAQPSDVPLESAVIAISSLLRDFDFPTPSDRSRALASMISPALKFGGWIDDDFPLDVAEALESQSGKTYRQSVVCRIYREKPAGVVSQRGGVGSLDESISKELMNGRPFISLANFRGKLDSTILEEAIRGSGTISCRGFRSSGEVSTKPFLWQLSTNGSEFTRDIANRSIITRIRKQPPGHEFQRFNEGDLLSHVEANQPFFLGAVFSIIKEWNRLGCQRTNESRHDFKTWCRVMDWIVQNIFGSAPLLDGHQEEQKRTSNPALKWLREIVVHLPQRDLGKDLSTSSLADLATDHEIDWPGNPFSKDDPAVRAGRILTKIFKESDSQPIVVDGFQVVRTEAPDYNSGGQTKKFYTVTKI